MSADHDGDSQMLSSPSEPSDNEIATPQSPVLPSSSGSILSPPNSQQRAAHSNMTTSTPGASIANSNGKRPLQTISNGLDDEPRPLDSSHVSSADRGTEVPAKTAASGYSWTHQEDEPGYAWLNKKALDEHHRAYDSLLHLEIHIGRDYPDPFEAADRERAIINSLKEQ